MFFFLIPNSLFLLLFLILIFTLEIKETNPRFKNYYLSLLPFLLYRDYPFVLRFRSPLPCYCHVNSGSLVVCGLRDLTLMRRWLRDVLMLAACVVLCGWKRWTARLTAPLWCAMLASCGWDASSSNGAAAIRIWCGRDGPSSSRFRTVFEVLGCGC